MTVMVAVPAMTVMMMMTHCDDNLGVRRLGERYSDNESEQGVQKDFHI
jgi:hypothetical protein